jgi:hypothetical protein
MEGNLQVVDVAEGVLSAVYQVHEEDALGSAFVVLVVRLRAKVALPTLSFLMHLRRCKAAKARPRTLGLPSCMVAIEAPVWTEALGR